MSFERISTDITTEVLCDCSNGNTVFLGGHESLRYGKVSDFVCVSKLWDSV